MTTPSLPRRTPGSSGRQPNTEAPDRIPWEAFTIAADTSATYGQPSPALIARARRGWKRLGNLHERLGQDGTQ
ncbi:hypothetical protein [Streptomyces sp. NPDC096033]|uniref:hypothetical protein n=1 Tax=Streptomyces sp. NPDC096033 TaxID=3366071 RepID=UPI0037FF5D0A